MKIQNIVIVLGVLIVGGAVFFYSNNSTQTTEDQAVVDSVKEEEEFSVEEESADQESAIQNKKSSGAVDPNSWDESLLEEAILVLGQENTQHLLSGDCKNVKGANIDDEYMSASDMCYFLLAVLEQEIAWCNEISTEEFINGCKSEIGLTLSYVKKDPIYCEDVPDNDKSDCYSDLARELGDPSLCEKYPFRAVNGERFCKEAALAGVAARAKDISLCDTITYSYHKSDCYTAVGAATLDVELCNQADLIEPNDSFAKPSCLRDIAILTGDTGYCDLINFGNWGEVCYEDVENQAELKTFTP